MRISLLALSLGAFGIGTTEFAMMGLLPDIAKDFDTTIPAAGYLISAYAFGVVVGAPLLAALFIRVSYRSALLAMMTLFTVGHACSALAPNFPVLLATRFFTALQHGAFLGVGAVVAATLVPSEKRARAVSFMFAGLTIANIVGVPLSPLLAEHLGWRSTFWLLAGIGVLCLLSVWRTIPDQGRPEGVSFRQEIRAFRNGQLWLALATTGLGYGGVFTAYSYVSPIITHLTGSGTTAVAIVMCLFGVGMTTGNHVGGRLADRNRRAALTGSLTVLALALLTLSATAHSLTAAAATILLIGAASSAAVPSLQTWVMDEGGEAATLTSASIHSAFNIGNAVGAALGGAVISAGLGYASPGWAGALMAAGALGCALCARMSPVRVPARQAA
ncbi:MFS transporter [Streptomyces sp. NPDC050121]|uniref:MFS transporter n=1 Tax=Streptomyces sp. NPDC050121 TaxID=3365601 RepID=UPI0037A0BA58